MVEYNWKKEREKYRPDFRKTEPEPVMQPAPPAAPETDWRKVTFAVIVVAVAVVVIIGIIFAVSSGKKTEPAPVAGKTPAAPVAAPAPVPAAAQLQQTPVSASKPSGQDSAAMLAAVAETNKSAVGLVVVSLTMPDGKRILSSIGTAWAFSRNRFATNAHVAIGIKKRFESFKLEFVNSWIRNALAAEKCKSLEEFAKKFGKGKAEALFPKAEAIFKQRFSFDAFVIINGSHRQSKSISHIQIHRDYGVIGSSFDPDVAVFTIRGTHDTYFKLAGSEQFRNLKSGEPVAFIGFPMENLTGKNVNIDNPVASMQSGIIVAVSDFEFKDVGPNGNYMIRHNLPATGGASGSPIFNRKGEVIAILNSGNIIGQVRNGKVFRAPSAAMVNFGVRVDLLDGIGDPIPLQDFLK